MFGIHHSVSENKGFIVRYIVNGKWPAIKWNLWGFGMTSSEAILVLSVSYMENT